MERGENSGKNNSLRKREQMQYYLLILSYILIGLYGLIFHIFFKITDFYILSITMTIIVPLILNTYSVFYHINYQVNHTPEEDLLELKMEMESEKAPTIIPVILFGLGIFLTRLGKGSIVKRIIPYLISGLLLGTVLTSLFQQLIFDWSNLDRMLLISGLDYIVLTMSFGYLFMSIILILIYLR